MKEEKDIRSDKSLTKFPETKSKKNRDKRIDTLISGKNML